MSSDNRLEAEAAEPASEHQAQPWPCGPPVLHPVRLRQLGPAQGHRAFPGPCLPGCLSQSRLPGDCKTGRKRAAQSMNEGLFLFVFKLEDGEAEEGRAEAWGVEPGLEKREGRQGLRQGTTPRKGRGAPPPQPQPGGMEETRQAFVSTSLTCNPEGALVLTLPGG